MAYNTKSLLRDVDGKIVPQGFDLTADAYKALTGQDLGGGRFGLDGVQWGKTASGLFVPIKVTNDGAQEVQLSGTIKLETIRTSTLDVTPGSTIELLAPREVDVNYSSVIINMDVSAAESSFVDGAPVVYYESARVIEFTVTNHYRRTVPTVFEPRTSTGASMGYSSKKMPVTGPFERIRIHNPSSTRDMGVRSVGLTYYRGL